MASGEHRGDHVGATPAVVKQVKQVKRMRRIVVALIGVLCALGAVSVTGTADASSDKSFSFESLDTVAEVQPDGSMLVTEVWVYDFRGGPFNFGIRSFESNVDQVRDFAASDLDGPLTVIAPDQSVSGDWEWQLRTATSDATVAYTLTYRVVDAIDLGADVSELNWKFISGEHPPVRRMSVTVRFPGDVPAASPDAADDDTTVLRGFAHGPTNGRIEVGTSTVTATVDGLGADEFVEVVVVAPATVFDRVGDTDRLSSILERERNLITELKDAADRRRLGWIVTPMLMLAGVVGTGLLWFFGGREKPSKEVLGEYWREPLDEPPAVAITNLARGSIDAGHVIAGTLVDMAQRGYLRIEGRVEQRFGPDQTVHHYIWLGKPYANDVLEYERDLMEMIFRGANETSSDEMNQWAKANVTTANSLLATVKVGVGNEYRARGYAEEANGKQVGMLFGLCALVGLGSFGLKVYTDNGIGWVGAALAVVLFGAGTKVLSNRSQASVESAAKAKGLKKFLEDFSRLEDAPVGHLILWERYLVYAVALGVSAKLLQGLAARVPEVMNNPAFGLWYVGPHGRFDGFDQIETAGVAAATASTPSSSGSGGGFSGGGSSGGGGGGSAGAR